MNNLTDVGQRQKDLDSRGKRIGIALLFALCLSTLSERKEVYIPLPYLCLSTRFKYFQHVMAAGKSSIFFSYFEHADADALDLAKVDISFPSGLRLKDLLVTF